MLLGLKRWKNPQLHLWEFDLHFNWKFLDLVFWICLVLQMHIWGFDDKHSTLIKFKQMHLWKVELQITCKDEGDLLLQIHIWGFVDKHRTPIEFKQTQLCKVDLQINCEGKADLLSQIHIWVFDEHSLDVEQIHIIWYSIM